jgi:hypothetical protein
MAQPSRLRPPKSVGSAPPIRPKAPTRRQSRESGAGPKRLRRRADPRRPRIIHPGRHARSSTQETPQIRPLRHPSAHLWAGGMKPIPGGSTSSPRQETARVRPVRCSTWARRPSRALRARGTSAACERRPRLYWRGTSPWPPAAISQGPSTRMLRKPCTHAVCRERTCDGARKVRAAHRRALVAAVVPSRARTLVGQRRPFRALPDVVRPSGRTRRERKRHSA